MKFPIVFAHRGANNFAPENSLSAFQKAIELGCEGIELDARFTADGDVVVFHDRHTFRMTGHRGSIQRMSTAQIRNLHLFGSTSTPEKIPLLQEVLEIAGRGMFINIDVKKESLAKNGFEEKILAILKEFGFRENIIISSFNPFVLKKITFLQPDLHLGYIFRNRSSLLMLNGQPIKSLHARYRLLSAQYMTSLRERGGQVYGWTVDDEPAMLDLIMKEVDGIITNRPEIFMELKNKITGWDKQKLANVEVEEDVNR